MGCRPSPATAPHTNAMSSSRVLPLRQFWASRLRAGTANQAGDCKTGLQAQQPTAPRSRCPPWPQVAGPRLGKEHQMVYPTDEQIRELAYRLWSEAGEPEDREPEF